MKNTFTRPTERSTEKFDEILRDMKEDLALLIGGAVGEDEVILCAKRLILEAKPLPKNPSMVFWGLDEPEHMPSDCRVPYFYTPTYMAVSMLAYIKMHGPKEAIALEGFEKTLKKGLLGATGRSFSGAGHDGLLGMIRCMDLFAEAKIHEFVDAYPKICPIFTSVFLKTRWYLLEKLETDTVRGDYGNDYGREAESVIRKMRGSDSEALIFVYGTLLKGNRNHEFFLGRSRYLGEANLKGYGLYHLGSYPGIKKKPGDSVKGEVYVVNRQTLTEINRLEGEGSLYELKEVSVNMEGVEIPYVGTYVYLHEVEEKNHVSMEEQPWGRKKEVKEVKELKDVKEGIKITEMKEKNLVWYAAYGSNMLYERFMCYLEGGQFRGKGRDHEPCIDPSAPSAKRVYEFTHDMYYAKESGTWDGMGVSFLDVTRPGKAYGVAYLITREQLEHLWREENGGGVPRPDSSWYNQKVELGVMEGIPVMTVTNSRVLKKNEPGTRYKEVLMEGLRENLTGFEPEEIRAYVESRNS